MEDRQIHVFLLKHNATGLFAAVSPDLRGLVVHGRSPEEIEHKLPNAIRELVEAEGYQVSSLTVEEDERIASSGFGPPAYIANASLKAGGGGDKRRILGRN